MDSEVQYFRFEEGGHSYELYVETRDSSALPEPTARGSRPGAMGSEGGSIDMAQVRQMIQGPFAYVLNAFKDFSAAEVEELVLKFGIKINGGTGIPVLTWGSTECHFEIEVKCKFPANEDPIVRTLF
jgi:hypothetical protein